MGNVVGPPARMMTVAYKAINFGLLKAGKSIPRVRDRSEP